jgi:DNA/RNA-binding domain of Phe-tRNA-synthetase-like protein
MAGVLVMRDVANPPQHPELDRRKDELENSLRTRFAAAGRAGIQALPTVQAYNAYFSRFKKTYHVQLQLESVTLKGKSIPRVATLVESMFMAELQNQLLTAGHDLLALRLPVTADVANGSERYVTFNGQEQVLKTGDMMMADAEGIISSVLYGPDQRTRITAETQQVLFAVYAPVGIGHDAVHRHLEDIQANVLQVTPSAKVELLNVFGAPTTP